MSKDKKKKKDKKTAPLATELICILDRSGSMRETRDDAEGGFNEFIDRQRHLDAGDCYVTLWQFDTEHENVWPRQRLTISSPQPYRLEPRWA